MLVDKTLMSGFQITKNLLLNVNRGLGEPGCFRAVSPGSQFLAEPGISQLLFTGCMSFLLKRQALVPDHANATGGFSQENLLVKCWFKSEFVGLQSIHYEYWLDIQFETITASR